MLLLHMINDDVLMIGQEGTSLAEDDENDLNVSLTHDDVSMTGQEGNSCAEVDKNGSNLTSACEDDSA